MAPFFFKNIRLVRARSVCVCVSLCKTVSQPASQRIAFACCEICIAITLLCVCVCVCFVFKWDLHHVFITRLLFRLFGHERIETASVDTSRWWWRVSEWEMEQQKREGEGAPQHYMLMSCKPIYLVWWWKSNKLLVLIFICLKKHTFRQTQTHRFFEKNIRNYRFDAFLHSFLPFLLKKMYNTHFLVSHKLGSRIEIAKKKYWLNIGWLADWLTGLIWFIITCSLNFFYT